jgi:hypothetical protein
MEALSTAQTTYPDNASREEFETAVAAFVSALNKHAAKRTKATNRPLYTSFGYTMGRAHARIFGVVSNGGKTAIAFFGRDGQIRRADNWRKTGRILGDRESQEAFDYVAGPMFR